MNQEQPVKRRPGRPPKDQDAFNETRESLLRSGMEILTEKSFSSTGLDEILRRVRVPKGSFYHYFDSKEDFGTELINHYDNYFLHKMNRFLTDKSLLPLEQLRSFVDHITDGMARYEYKRGCLVGNLGQEMGALPEPFREQIKSIFENWQHKVEHCLKAAQQAQQISPDADCSKLAAVFWIGWEGAVLRAKLEQSPTPLNTFSSYFFESLGK